MGVGRAHAKLLLFGEHAAVYGHPAVGRALPWTLTVTHTPAPSWTLPGLGEHEAAVRDVLEHLELWAAEQGWTSPLPGRLTVETDVPLASGFGSSGALCAALCNLFWPEKTLEERDVMAWRAEGLFHGTPSGIDTALALRQGWWHLDPHYRPVKASPLPDPGLILVAGSVVRQTNTRALVAGLAQRREANDPVAVQTLDQLGRCSAVASQALAASRLDPLPGLLAEARSGLQALGLESPDLTAVLDAGEACQGCRGGKLSGAGGGGAFFLVFSDVASAKAALKTIEGAVAPERWTARPQVV